MRRLIRVVLYGFAIVLPIVTDTEIWAKICLFVLFMSASLLFVPPAGLSSDGNEGRWPFFRRRTRGQSHRQ